MAESAHNLTAARTPDALWQRIVQDYRQAWILRRQARRAESDQLLHDELPARILAWAELDASDGAAQARRLDDMFEAEQRRLADLWLVQECMEHRLRTDLLPTLTARIDAEVRQALERHAASRPLPPVTAPCPTPVILPRAEDLPPPTRVSAGDIPSIIDLLFERERQSGARHLAA